MAYKEISLDAYWGLSCTATETGTDTGANTSTVSVTGRIWRKNNINAFSYTGAGNLEIYWHDDKDNTDVWLATLGVDEIGYSVNERTTSKSFSVTHKDDGSLNGYAFAKWVKLGSASYIPVSGQATTDWFALTSIPRGAKVSAAPDFNDEANPTVTYSNPAGNAVNLLQLGIFGTNGTTAYAGYRDVSKTGTSYTFNLTTTERNALRNAIPNAKSMKVRVYIKTGIGSNTFLDYKEVTMTIVNGTPTFSNFTFADTNSTTTGVTGNNQVMISGKSSLSATISAANKAVAVKGASITKYTFAIAGLTAEQAYSTSNITKAIGSPTVASNELPSGTRDLVITATDSRGFTKAVTKTVTIVPYVNPIVNASATRTNNFENTTTIKISGTISRIVVGGTAKNTVNATSGVQYRYKASTSSTWGSWTNRASSVDTSTGAVTTTNFTLELNNQNAYDFQMRITDKLTTATVDVTVPVGQPAMWLGTDGRVGIGGMPTRSKATGESSLLELPSGRIYGNIGILKTNPAVATDTPAGWASAVGQGKTIINYTQTGCFAHQKSQYGILETDVTGQDVVQVWTNLSTQRKYVRGGYNTDWRNFSGQFAELPQIGPDAKVPTILRFEDVVGETTVTRVTNTGKSITIYRKNNGSNNIIVAPGISYVHRVLSVWAGTNMPNNIGVAGLSSGSTIWSYYSGTKDGVSVNTYESLTTDGQTDGFYYGTAVSTSGAKYGVVIDYTAKKLTGQTWILLGNIQASGSGFALGFRMEVQAKDDNTIPTIYWRGTPPTNSTLSDQIEFIE